MNDDTEPMDEIVTYSNTSGLFDDIIPRVSFRFVL